MVRYCCVPNCKTYDAKGVSFHKFPSTPKIRKEWIIKLRMGKAVSPRMVVCSKHFHNDDYFQLAGYTHAVPQLKKSAVPSANLPTPSFYRSPNKVQQAERHQRRQKRETMKQVDPGIQSTAAEDKEKQPLLLENAIDTSNCQIPEKQQDDIADMEIDTTNLTIPLNSGHGDSIASEHDVILPQPAEEQTRKDEVIAILQRQIAAKDELIEKLEKCILDKNCELLQKDKLICEQGKKIYEISAQNSNALLQLSSAENEIKKLQTDFNIKSKSDFSMNNLKCDDTLVNYYTGIANYELFLALLNYLVPNADTSIINYQSLSPKYLPLEDQLLTVLVKLRQNFGHRDLAFRLRKSSAGISRLIKIWINYMYLRLGSLCLWPHRDVLIANSPEDFKLAFPNVIVVIDGTEMYVEKPSDLRMQSQTYSTYKSSNTIKGLVGVDQRGGIIFVSQLMDGSISDREICKESGFLSVIENKIHLGELLSTDEVMADKGFTVSDILKTAGVNLVIPPFASSAHQMSVADVCATKEIAKFRVHVERAMGRIKRFKVLSGIIPLTIYGSINQIWTVSCFLANMQLPLLKK